MKQLIVLAIAVGLGIWVYRRYSASKVQKSGKTTAASDLSPGPFNGPDVDPKTGAYLPMGVMPGTVEASAQGN